jgi:HAD superfamily phosphoserine phosphatase-like hydrolase
MGDMVMDVVNTIEKRSLILDFDGTLTMVDVGDALCERFAPPLWREIDLRYARGELSLPEAQRQMWGLFRATREQARIYAREVGVLREGVDALLDAARTHGYAIRLASGGFDFYVEAILGDERLSRFESVHINTIRFSGNQVEPRFADPIYACERCAVCKAKVCAKYGPGSVFVGDGLSDACALGKVERIFAVKGKRLHQLALERGHAVTAFESLTEVASRLESL